MGSYTRSVLIGSLIGLIGIGICLVLEQRRRNMGQVPSDRRLAQVAWHTVTAEESETHAVYLPSKLSSQNDGSSQRGDPNKLQKVKNTKEVEDDVTFLYGPISNISIQDQSTPGLPQVCVNSNSMIDEQNEGDGILFRDTTETCEPHETVITESRSDGEVGDNSFVLPRLKSDLKDGNLDVPQNNGNEEAQTNKETGEAIEDPFMLPLSTTFTDYSTEGETETFHRDVQSNMFQFQNNDEFPISRGHNIADQEQNKEDAEDSRVDEIPTQPPPNYDVETLHPSIIPNATQCTVETGEGRDVPLSINLGLNECSATIVNNEDQIIAENYWKGPGQTIVSAYPVQDCTSDKLPEFDSSNVQNTWIDGAMEKNNGATLSGLVDDHDPLPAEETHFAEHTKDSLQDSQAQLSSAPQTHCPLPTEETCSSQPTKDSLQDSQVPIVSAPQTLRNFVHDSITETVNKDSGSPKCAENSAYIQPLSNHQQVSDIATIPPNTKKSSRRVSKKCFLPKEDNEGTPVSVDTGKDVTAIPTDARVNNRRVSERFSIRKEDKEGTPVSVDIHEDEKKECSKYKAKHRVRKLVGFFESKK